MFSQSTVLYHSKSFFPLQKSNRGSLNCWRSYNLSVGRNMSFLPSLVGVAPTDSDEVCTTEQLRCRKLCWLQIFQRELSEVPLLHRLCSPDQPSEGTRFDTATLDPQECNADNTAATLDIPPSVVSCLRSPSRLRDTATLATLDSPNKKVFAELSERNYN